MCGVLKDANDHKNNMTTIQVPEAEANLYSVHFFSKERAPHVRRLIDYELTVDGGHITFDGYYYIDDSEFPKTVEMYFSKQEPEPYKVVNGGHYYRHEFDMVATVELMERETGRITDRISKELDEDGEEMNVCFFPTKIQRIHFRVLELHKLEEGQGETCSSSELITIPIRTNKSKESDQHAERSGPEDRASSPDRS